MRKVAVLLLAIIIFVSAAVLTQRKMYEEKNSFNDIKENMSIYEYGEGTLGIALIRVMTSKSIIHNFGKPIYPKDRELQYVWVYINAINSGATAVQIEPKEFTLSVPGKAAVDYDLKATNSMQKCFKSISLDPDKQNIGVLIFPLPESREYILHYNGYNGKVEKRLVIDLP